MKRWLALMLAVMVLPLSVQSFAAEEGKMLPEQENEAVSKTEERPLTLAALGDSITRGYGLNDGEKCYVDIVADDCGFEANNFAVNGQTSVVLLESLQNPSAEQRTALENADYIVITIGGNDMLYLLNSLVKDVIPSDGGSITADTINNIIALAEKLTPESMNSDIAYYKKTVAEIIRILQGMNDHAIITMQTVYNPFKPIFVVAPVILPAQSDNIKAAQDSIDNCIAGFNMALAELSEEYDFRIADVCNDFQNSDKKLLNMSLSYPDIHPNAAGHKRIAEIVEETIDPEGELRPTKSTAADNAESSDTDKVSSKASEFSTESKEAVESSDVSESSDSSQQEEGNHSREFMIFIGIMAVLSFIITFSKLKRKKRE